MAARTKITKEGKVHYIGMRSRAWHESNAKRIQEDLCFDIPVKHLSKRQIAKEYTPERIAQLFAACEQNRFNPLFVPLSEDGVSTRT